MLKDKIKQFNIIKKLKHSIVICCFVLLFLLITFSFSTSINSVFKLEPNLRVVENSSLQVHYIDVGQGDATAIRFPNNKTMLIDSGAYTSKDKLVKYLNNIFFKNNKRVFNYVLITHTDLDHIGNMQYIIDNYKIDNFLRPKIYASGVEQPEIGTMQTNNYYYANMVKSLKQRHKNKTLNFITLKQNTTFNLDDNTSVKFYNCDNDFNNATKLNDCSVVTKLTCYNKSFLFMGDATINVERDLIATIPPKELKCDVLKLGHHGSATSSSMDFLNAVNASKFIISCGINSYDFPSDAVVNNLITYSKNNNLNYNNSVYRTDQLGNVIFALNNDVIKNLNIKNVNNYIFVNWNVINIYLICFNVAIIVGLICVLIYKISKFKQI